MKTTKPVGVFVLTVAVFACVASCMPEEPAPSSQPAKELTLDLGNNVTMKLVEIPAGKFMMGSPKDEKDRRNNEELPREVTISQPFYMGIYEVTQEQWAAVMGDTQRGGYAKNGPEYAANYISWNDATDFCNKLSAKTGKAVRLPTEAQWEYACRAGSKTRFSYGEDEDHSKLGDYAWFDANAWSIGEHYPHAVGQKKPNGFGLYDMHGNLWEWCADLFPQAVGSGWSKDEGVPPPGSFRVLRGGAFCLGQECCRSAARLHGVQPPEGWFGAGVRVIIDPTAPAGVKEVEIAVQRPPAVAPATEAERKGELTRKLAATILNEYLAKQSVSEIEFRVGGIDRAVADGVMKYEKGVAGEPWYSFTAKGLKMVDGFVVQASSVRIGGFGYDGSGTLRLRAPIGETVAEVTGITMDGPMPTVEFTTLYVIPAEMTPFKPYIFTAAKKAVVFRKYDDGWRVNN